MQFISNIADKFLQFPKTSHEYVAIQAIYFWCSVLLLSMIAPEKWACKDSFCCGKNHCICSLVQESISFWMALFLLRICDSESHHWFLKWLKQQTRFAVSISSLIMCGVFQLMRKKNKQCQCQCLVTCECPILTCKLSFTEKEYLILTKFRELCDYEKIAKFNTRVMKDMWTINSRN